MVVYSDRRGCRFCYLDHIRDGVPKEVSLFAVYEKGWLTNLNK